MLCSSVEFPPAAWLWIYRSVGVSHRVWFMIAWLMRISILYGLLTSSAHKLHLLLFSLIQGHEIWGRGGGCRLPLNNGNLSVPLELTRSSSKARLKVCWSPWAAEAWFNVYHIFHLHIQPIFSCFTFSQIKRLHVKKGGVLGSFHASRQNQLLWSKLPNLTLPLYLNLHKCSFEYNKSIHLLSNPDVLIRDLHLHVAIIKMSSVFLLSGKNLRCVHVCVLKKKKQC